MSLRRGSYDVLSVMRRISDTFFTSTVSVRGAAGWCKRWDEVL